MRTAIWLAMALALPVRLAAQWQARVEGAVESVSGVTAAAESGAATFGIHHPTWIGLRVESPGARVQGDL